ncbi:zinc-dependent metalloprotease [Pedobacter africanus]|uniref:Uncharacterized protein n=1 Tax=Pedobacter africanus TaxID=151894 RepID=A0ACC6KZG6_9SPHI|nr:zinc-dependent metalloprotease [Pedobacter africanus]MDR6784580.1 hypothetical protein [Pedobacter africanus]
MKPQFKYILTFTSLSLCLWSCSVFKKRSKYPNSKTAAVVAKDTIKTPMPLAKVPKPFATLITSKALADSGLLNIYKQEDKYYLEISDSLLNRDIIIISRISKSAAENRAQMMGYSGDQINNKVIRFDKGLNDKLFIRQISFAERAGDSTAMMYRSLLNSNIQPIVQSFEIKALSKNKNGSIIDITEYLNGDNDLLFFDAKIKTAMQLGGLTPDRSYILGVRSYPTNMEIKTMKTYSKSSGGFASYELNTSVMLLPGIPMRPRLTDQRVGYFTVGYNDFNSNPQGVDNVEMITRWRLEPKPADRERYLKGELVEPVKQIVFYIDPATPKQWVPYLMQGVNDWNVAFEAAGFKNAIVAKEAPTKEQDSTWSIEDARYNVIVYKPSTIGNASGPHVNDPRTGEILESHVNWYHNIMKLLRDWYFVQASAIDPRARKMKFDEKLMGQLIRFVSSHEIGHTLGLRHNFGSSAMVPVKNLRNKAWLDGNGHTPSIMDYARFNYVAQPEDGITEKGIFPRIGDYDKWAIEWAYRWYPADRFPSTDAEKAYLNNWIIAKNSGNKRLWFGSETNTADPRNQSEDLGDNAMQAGAYGIKNLKRIVPNILKWTAEPNADYSNAAMMYGEVLKQYDRYLGHVVRYIGGVMNNPLTVETKGDVFVPVAKARQKGAVQFLQNQLFDTPLWLLNKELFNKTGAAGLTGVISNSQGKVLSKLLDQGNLFMMQQYVGISGKAAYSPAELLQDLRKGIFSELTSGKAISVYRRNLQKAYLDRLMQVLKPKDSTPFPATKPDLNDVSTVVKMEIRTLHGMVKAAVGRTVDRMSRAHLMDLEERIQDFYKDKK